MTNGSQWRKWDLHVHAPTTRLNNQFKLNDIDGAWESFCETIHNSDVRAVGIADYYDLRPFFEFTRRYREFHPGDTERVFFPNLELRLNQFFNNKVQHANVHVIFKPALSANEAEAFAHHLKLTSTDSSLSRNITMKQTEDWSTDALEGATVTIDAIKDAIRSTFSNIEHLTDGAVVIASGRTDGISPGGNHSQRNFNLIDEVDKQVDAIFSRAKDAEHWLNPSRISGATPAPSKPTFGGCDAHSQDDLFKMLGRSGSDSSRSWETTWVKADLTYEGLLQTLAEPRERVRIQPTEPDTKSDMYVIDKISFPEPDSFPKEVHFNRNLNAIIGSRSSGKSSLLAYLAYAADPEETIRQQTKSALNNNEAPGPAAGYTWEQVSSIEREISWGSGATTTGSVVYVPQNSLYSLSTRPSEVSEKIEPALIKEFPELGTRYQRYRSDVEVSTGNVRNLIEAWMAWRTSEIDAADRLSEIGDRDSIIKSQLSVREELAAATSELSLSPDELDHHKNVKSSIDENESTEKRSEDELRTARAALGMDDTIGSGTENTTFDVTVALPQTSLSIPQSLQNVINGELAAIRREAKYRVRAAFQEWEAILLDRSERAKKESRRLRDDNADLLARVAEAEVVEQLAKRDRDHQEKINQIDEIDREIERLQKSREQTELDIRSALSDRVEKQAEFIRQFEVQPRVIDSIEVEIDQGYDPDRTEYLTSSVRLNVRSAYMRDASSGQREFDLENAHADPARFLRDCFGGQIPLKKGASQQVFANEVLNSGVNIRFAAVMDGDRIGGYSPSTMTPGKQALFALTLILHESDAPWPLLIDQPEDDLDARSIFSAVVPYLKERKRERQIIMVTHDANLVVGADAEAVIVANRHGDDRPNEGGREFDYRTGSIEDLTAVPDSGSTLAKIGIREHCCEILDGGSEAFLKRRQKYRLN